MARHRDISWAAAKLEGAQGFSIKTIRTPKQKRRSKKKCHYYSNGTCTYAHTSCAGVDCGSYYE